MMKVESDLSFLAGEEGSQGLEAAAGVRKMQTFRTFRGLFVALSPGFRPRNARKRVETGANEAVQFATKELKRDPEVLLQVRTLDRSRP